LCDRRSSAYDGGSIVDIAIGHPGAKARGRELAAAPTGRLLEDTCVDEIHQLNVAVTSEAGNLGEWHGGDRFTVVPNGATAGDPVPLDRRARDESGAAAVGLRVDVEIASLHEQADRADRQLEPARRGSEFHGALVERPHALMFSMKDRNGLLAHLELATRRVLLEVETEAADALIELVISNAELLGEIGKQGAIRETVTKRPDVAEPGPPTRYALGIRGKNAL
jgi:hypothetical protein